MSVLGRLKMVQIKFQVLRTDVLRSITTFDYPGVGPREREYGVPRIRHLISSVRQVGVAVKIERERIIYHEHC